MGYSGWTNWDTWNLALWINNEESLYHKGRVMAGEEQRFRAWARVVCEDINAEHEERIEWEKVNVEEVRDSLLEE